MLWVVILFLALFGVVEHNAGFHVQYLFSGGGDEFGIRVQYFQEINRLVDLLLGTAITHDDFKCVLEYNVWSGGIGRTMYRLNAHFDLHILRQRSRLSPVLVTKR